MRDLLNASSQRVIEILETLVDHEGWVTTAEIAETVRSSERTVSKDIAVLKKRWGQGLGIDISTKNGIRLNNRNVATVSKVFIDIFNESTALQWIREMLFNPGKGIEFYEDKIFTSRSTLIRLLPRINRFLAKRNMAVKYEGNRYELIGEDEQYLRQFFTGFLLELNGLDLSGYRIDFDLGVLGHLVSGILEHNLDEFGWSFVAHDDIATVYYMMFYLVSLVRENQGHTVASEHQTDGEIDADQLSYIKSRFPRVTEVNLRPIHSFIVSQYCGWDSEEEEALVTREADAFSERLAKATNVSFDKEMLQQIRFVMRSLYLTAKTRPYRTSELFDRIHYFALSIEKSNPPLYEMFQSNLAVFSQNIQFDVSLHSDSIVFWLCLTCPELVLAPPRKRVLVVSDFGQQHATFLARSIENLFDKGAATVVDITPASYADALMLLASEEYDIVVTTIPGMQSQRARVILVNDYLGYADFCQLYRELFFRSASAVASREPLS